MSSDNNNNKPPELTSTSTTTTITYYDVTDSDSEDNKHFRIKRKHESPKMYLQQNLK